MISKLKVADNPENIQRAAELLKKGGIIVHPTETLYGFAANAFLINAIKHIDRIKERKFHETYLILLKNIEMARQFGIFFDKMAEKLALRHWPGPLTMVLPITKGSPLLHLAVKGTIAGRVSPDKCVKELFQHIDFPIISTSVNKSGDEPLNHPEKINRIFRREVDLILERGVITNSRPSTIISVKDNNISTIRKGLISEKEIYGI